MKKKKLFLLLIITIVTTFFSACGSKLVENCTTTQNIEFLGNEPLTQSNFYIIGTAHTYDDVANLEGYVYDNGGLILKAFQKIHKLEHTDVPLTLYTEGIPLGSEVGPKSLIKVIPVCVTDMGYTRALGIDGRTKAEQKDGASMIKKFSNIFTEYCEIRQDGNILNGRLKKEIPPDVFLWLRDTWYSATIMPDIHLEQNILRKKEEGQHAIVVCGLRHAMRMGLAGKLSSAIVAVDRGMAFLETKEQGMASSRILAERYVTEGILHLPYLP